MIPKYSLFWWLLLKSFLCCWLLYSIITIGVLVFIWCISIKKWIIFISRDILEDFLFRNTLYYNMRVLKRESRNYQSRLKLPLEQQCYPLRIIVFWLWLFFFLVWRGVVLGCIQLAKWLHSLSLKKNKRNFNLLHKIFSVSLILWLKRIAFLTIYTNKLSNIELRCFFCVCWYLSAFENEINLNCNRM